MYPTIDPEVIVEAPKKDLLDPDFSLGMEGIPIPVINSVDNNPKPKMIYNSTRFARSEGVNQLLESSRHARSCCSCIGDCSDTSSCECQQLTLLEHSRLNTQLQGSVTSYKFGFLDARIQSGIYECNSKCLCNKEKCFNYIAQRRIEIPIEVSFWFFNLHYTCFSSSKQHNQDGESELWLISHMGVSSALMLVRF